MTATGGCRMLNRPHLPSLACSCCAHGPRSALPTAQHVADEAGCTLGSSEKLEGCYNKRKAARGKQAFGEYGECQPAGFVLGQSLRFAALAVCGSRMCPAPRILAAYRPLWSATESRHPPQLHSSAPRLCWPIPTRGLQGLVPRWSGTATVSSRHATSWWESRRSAMVASKLTTCTMRMRLSGPRTELPHTPFE